MRLFFHGLVWLGEFNLLTGILLMREALIQRDSLNYTLRENPFFYEYQVLVC